MIHEEARASGLAAAFLPRLVAVLFILLFLGSLSLGPRMLNVDGDLPRHLLLGKVVLETGSPPAREIFSYPYENRPYASHEWLADVIYYLAYLRLGLDGVVLVAAVLIAATFALLYSETTSRNHQKVFIFLLMILGALVTSIHWITRPHLFTMALLAIWLILVERLSHGRRVSVWVFPALMVLWANIHAEFIAGFLVLAAYIAGWVWQFRADRTRVPVAIGKKLLFAALLCLPASLLSAPGLRTWDTVFGYVGNHYLLSRIVETRPPDFTRGEYWPYLILLGMTIVLLATRKARFTPAHVFLIAGFGLMSLLAARNTHLAGVVFPFVLASTLRSDTELRGLRSLDTRIQQVESQVQGIWLPIFLTVLISALVITGPLSGFNRFEPTVFPVEAVSWLEDHPQKGWMFNAFDWGGYIAFRLWPEQKTFIDSQMDLTGEITKKYETVITLQEGWQNIFQEYGITWAILPPDWPLTRELTGQGWAIVYEDGTAVILVKR